MTSLRTNARLAVLSALALVLLLTACGQERSTPPDERLPPTSELRLGLTEWSIETGGVEVLPGEVQVRVTNTGGTRHDVIVHGQQGTWASPVLDPGETHDMVITTIAGEELHLVCSLTGHEVQGMHTRVNVVHAR